MTTLYLLDESKNKLRSWQINLIEMPDGRAFVRTQYGLVDGKQVDRQAEIAPSKTKSAVAIAKTEINNKILGKKREGYDEDATKALNARASDKKLLRACLAKPATPKRISDLKYPVYVEPKIDGNRHLAEVVIDEDDAIGLLFNTQEEKVRHWTRGSLEVHGFEHLDEEITKLYKFLRLSKGTNERIVVDGELFTWELPFEVLNGVTNTTKDTYETLQKKALFQYYVYDYFTPNTSMAKRAEQLAAFKKNNPNLQSVVILERTLVHSEEELWDAHNKHVEEGYEGSMIRLLDSKTKYVPNKRSSNLLKLKDFDDTEFTILDVISNKDGHPTFSMMTLEGESFSVTPAVDEAGKRHIQDNPDAYIGREITVIHKGTYDNGIPREARAKV